MVFWLLDNFTDGRPDWFGSSVAATDRFLAARIFLAGLTAFAACVCLGPLAIAGLRRRFRERIASASETLNRLHADKQETPTMGGLYVMAAVLASTLLWVESANAFVWIGLLTAGLLTVLGATDDWIKQRTVRNGLAARHKLAAQLIIATLAGISLRWKLGDGPETAFVWPFEISVLSLAPCFVAWVVLVLVGTANAVNLTDGLDGLAAGCTVLCGLVMTVVLYWSGDWERAESLSVAFVAGSGELAVVLGALVGAMLGFLWFNCHPADVFMGDAGALSAGGLLAVAAVVSRQELLLVIAGGVFVVETLSVIVQVSCYRLTGKRPLRCSPLHNHFVFRGDRETRIVTRFWIMAGLLAIAALSCVAQGYGSTH